VKLLLIGLLRVREIVKVASEDYNSFLTTSVPKPDPKQESRIFSFVLHLSFGHAVCDNHGFINSPSLKGCPAMAGKSHKERLIIIYPERDPETGRWSVKVVRRRMFELPDRFDNQHAAAEYALKWAITWIAAPAD
jgi:hypothetical protein